MTQTAISNPKYTPIIYVRVLTVIPQYDAEAPDNGAGNAFFQAIPYPPRVDSLSPPVRAASASPVISDSEASSTLKTSTSTDTPGHSYATQSPEKKTGESFLE